MQDLQNIVNHGYDLLNRKERNKEDIKNSALNLIRYYAIFITEATNEFLAENENAVFAKGHEITKICFKLFVKYDNFQEPEEEPRMNRFR